MRRGRPLTPPHWLLIAIGTLGLVACGPLGAPGAPTATPPTPVETGASSGSAASPTVAGLDAPPDAVLAAEGGDPVTGQLGSYVWNETGSDSPWLPGAPIRVGSGEPMAVTLAPAGPIEAWRTRYVPAAASDPTGAASLGEGSGQPGIIAPGPGSWTVEVTIDFGVDVGTASYFWRLDVE